MLAVVIVSASSAFGAEIAGAAVSGGNSANAAQKSDVSGLDAQGSATAKMLLLKQFDKDGDGRLNKAERAEARKAMKGKMADFEQIRRKHAKDIVARFDRDGDGKLSEEELIPFLEEQRKMFEGFHRRRAMRERAIPKEILAKYDRDGDGKLSREERKAMFEDARARREALLKKYDRDGDGKLSEEERSELVKDPEVQNMMKRMIGGMINNPPPPPPPSPSADSARESR